MRSLSSVVKGVSLLILVLALLFTMSGSLVFAIDDGINTDKPQQDRMGELIEKGSYAAMKSEHEAIMHDSHLGSTTLSASVLESVQYLEAFPDANFRREVLRLLNIYDGNRTDESIISAEDIALMASFTTLDVEDMGISDMTGLSYFEGLQELWCGYNQLSELDTSYNPLLEWLICWNNQLTTLEVSCNPTLLYLDCRVNQLSSLDVSQNIWLWGINCGGNQLNELDVSENIYLQSLYCWGNQLAILDVSSNTILTILSCWNNRLTTLDASDAVALNVAWCDSNQLADLDISKNTALWSLECYSNQLTKLDVTNNIALVYLNCINNHMQTPDDVSGWQEIGLILEETFLFYPQMTSPFIPVTDITSVPTEATAGVPLLLSGTVFPAKATNQTITWSVNDAGSTGATIEGDTLTATAAGTVVITATVEDGLEDGVSYAKDFTVTVYEELIEEYNFTVYFNSPPTPYSPGDTVYVDILLEGDLNFTMAEVSAAYDTDLLEYLGYENVSGWMNQIYREGSDLITVRNLPTSNLNAGAPCTEPVRLLTLKFKVKNTLPEDEVKTDVSFAAINVYPTPNITDATTAPGKSLTITLNDLI